MTMVEINETETEGRIHENRQNENTGRDGK